MCCGEIDTCDICNTECDNIEELDKEIAKVTEEIEKLNSDDCHIECKDCIAEQNCKINKEEEK